MNLIKDHKVNTRILTTVNTEPSELVPDPNKNYLFDLSYLGIINLHGEKAIEFLQGQLTCDLNLVSDITMIQGAQCNLKGRILSLLDVINWNGVKLVLPRDLIEATINSLSRTAQLSKVVLQEDSEYRVLGFLLQNPNDLLPDTPYFSQELYTLSYTSQFCYYYLGKGFYIFIVPKNEVSNFSDLFIEKSQFLGSLNWHILRLLQNQIEIYPESRGLFLPHRLGLHETNYISFNKGCYKGQEIIARTHYRATIKHELRLYTIVSKESIYSGQKLFKSNEEIELGELIDYADLPNDRYLIAVSIVKESATSARFEGHSNVVTLDEPEIF